MKPQPIIHTQGINRMGKRYYIKTVVTCFSITVMSMLLCLPTYSQSKKEAVGKPKNDLQKIESLKKAYLSKELDLSPQESEKFWPTYEQYEKKMYRLNQARRQNRMDKKEINKASEQQVKKSIDHDFHLQQQVLQTRKSYQDKFMEILPPKKVMKFYKSEREFNSRLIKELRRRSDDTPKASVQDKEPGQQP